MSWNITGHFKEIFTFFLGENPDLPLEFGRTLDDGIDEGHLEIKMKFQDLRFSVIKLNTDSFSFCDKSLQLFISTR